MSIDLTGLRLYHGSHSALTPYCCLLEACALAAGEPKSDNPDAVSELLASLGRGINDALSDEPRQALIPLIPALIRTRETAHLDEQRRTTVRTWLLHTYLATWADLCGLRDAAEELRAADHNNCLPALVTAYTAAREVRAPLVTSLGIDLYTTRIHVARTSLYDPLIDELRNHSWGFGLDDNPTDCLDQAASGLITCAIRLNPMRRVERTARELRDELLTVYTEIVNLTDVTT